MELRHMRYFVAVAEHLNYGRAAEALSTAQPSLSRQIQQLEAELGVMLFERTNKRVALTGAGRTFLVDARRTLQSADLSLRHAHENADGTRGELRLGFVGGAMMMKLPLVLSEYRRRFPNVEIIPHAMHYPEHHPALRAGTIDLAWTVAEPSGDISSEIVSSERLVAVVPASHPLATRKRIAIADFTNEGIVLIRRTESPRLYTETMRLCAINGFHPAQIHEVIEEQTVLGLIAAGFGVALVPSSWSVIHVPGIVFSELDGSYSIAEHLSWQRDRISPIIRAFVATAREVMAQTSTTSE